MYAFHAAVELPATSSNFSSSSFGWLATATVISAILLTCGLSEITISNVNIPDFMFLLKESCLIVTISPGAE